MFTISEMKVIRLAYEGCPTKVIAQRLYRTEGTVKGILTAIYKKLNISTRYELIVVCAKNKSMISDARIIKGSWEINRGPIE